MYKYARFRAVDVLRVLASNPVTTLCAPPTVWRMLIQENKWRAVRYGLEGKLIDFGKQTEVPVRDLVLELLEFVDDVVDELGSRKEIEHVHTILDRGTSADRQLQVYRETDDLKAVVDDLIELTMENVPEPATVVAPRPATTTSTIAK